MASIMHSSRGGRIGSGEPISFLPFPPEAARDQYEPSFKAARFGSTVSYKNFYGSFFAINNGTRDRPEKGSAPIDRLPADVLIEIFQFASSYFLGLYNSRNTICAVCRGWRELALGFPRLWTEINIDVAVCYPPLPLLKMWLERSCDASLSIDLTCLFHLFTVKLEKHQHWQPHLSVLSRERVKLYIFSTMPVLMEHIHRWKYFSYMVISAPGDGPYNAALLTTLSLRNAVRLEVLKLVTKVVATAELEILSAAAEIPNLRRFNWSISNRSRLSTNNIFPWHRLEHVTLHGSSKHVSSVVGQCTSAITLNLLVDLTYPMQRQPQATYPLHELKGLNIQCYLEGLRLLREIDCPNLEILRISIMTHDDSFRIVDDDGDDDVLWDHLLTFLLGSNHKLRILQIEEKEEIIQCDLLEKLFLGPSRLTKELYGMEMMLDYGDGTAHDTVRQIQDAWKSSKSTFPVPLLDRYELTAFGDEFLHVGWVREEFEPFLKQRGYSRDVAVYMDPYEKLMNLERDLP